MRIIYYTIKWNNEEEFIGNSPEYSAYKLYQDTFGTSISRFNMSLAKNSVHKIIISITMMVNIPDILDEWDKEWL